MDNERIIDAGISYQYSFSIFDNSVKLSDEEKVKKVFSALERRFPGCIKGESPAAAENTVFQELETARSFLHGGGLPFECKRMLITGFGLTFPGADIRESAVLLSIFPEFNAAQLMICFEGKNLTTDEMIYLRHIHGGTAQFDFADGKKLHLDGIYELIAKAMDCGCDNVERTYFAEIKAFRPYDRLEDILANEKRRIYGMMSGDEGWQFVPEELAEERLGSNWGSRNFMRFMVFGNSSLLLNLTETTAAKAYIERQYDFGGRIYGGINPYFLLNSSVAGINHGIIFSQEMVMVIKTISTRILNRPSSFASGKTNNLGQEIRMTRAFRSELITTLNRVENLGISEMGELEQTLLQSQRITPLIENIKYLLELLEGELDLLYQESTNRLVNLLTVAGLILSVIGTMIDLGWLGFLIK